MKPASSNSNEPAEHSVREQSGQELCPAVDRAPQNRISSSYACCSDNSRRVALQKCEEAIVDFRKADLIKSGEETVSGTFFIPS